MKRLLSRRLHQKIINDIIFIRLLINSGGYAHTHKILDFDQIDDNYKANEEYVNSSAYNEVAPWMAKEMRRIGYNQTKRLLAAGKYSTGEVFRNSLHKYVTSKSSGLPPIDVTVNIKGEELKTKFASKAAFLMLHGKEAIDVSIINKSNPELPSLIKKDVEEKIFKSNCSREEENRICREYGISKIGSRSTVAFRDIRAIFINPMVSHLVQAALIYPHIEETTRRPSCQPKSVLIDEDYGSCIATMYMDGSTDLIANSIMSSSSGNYVSILSDCSQWDQTFVSMDSIQFYTGVRDALSDSPHLLKNEIYMYDRSMGLGLVQLADWFNEFHEKRYYLADYAGEVRLFSTNFMWSGRLDTFFLNCIQNHCVNKRINDVLTEVHRLPPFGFLSIAGDDVAAVIPATDWNSSKTTIVKEVVIKAYTSTNHKINSKKSAVTARSGEYAKIYWYAGMMFRDPSIQLFEAEKSQKSTTRVEYVRGYSQKLFEYLRRAKTNMRIGSTYCRLLLSLTYFLDARVKSGRGRIRYIPPYQSIICPTFVKGGLGFTVTGISINESLFIRVYLSKWIEPSLPFLALIKVDVDNDLADLLFEYYSSHVTVAGDVNNTNHTKYLS